MAAPYGVLDRDDRRAVNMPGPYRAAHRADTRRCRCGHIADTHLHYRRGSDCGLCGIVRCPRMRPERWRRIGDWAVWAVAVLRTRRFWRRHRRGRRLP